METRGRPRIRQDDEILGAALEAFAAQGYDAMSLRSLNAQLGLSHGTISQRFGTKERLYFAAIDLGFATFVADIDERRRHLLAATDPDDDLAHLGRLRLQHGTHHYGYTGLHQQRRPDGRSHLHHVRRCLHGNLHG